jgi:hypothetical protein
LEFRLQAAFFFIANRLKAGLQTIQSAVAASLCPAHSKFSTL